MSAIAGESVTLRPIIPSDIADYERWNNPALEAFRYDGPHLKGDLSGVIEARKSCISKNQSVPYRFLEIETLDHTHIGWVNAYNFANIHDVLIGISIMEDTQWSKGLGTESLTLWVDYLFRAHNLTRGGFKTWSGNIRMIKLGQRLGFKEEARIRNSCFVYGKFYDGIGMGILRDEWCMAPHVITTQKQL